MRQDLFREMFEMEKNYWWYKSKRCYVIKLINKFVLKNGRRDLSILDMGCGTGCMLQDLQKYGEVYGIDMSKRAVGFCKMRGLKNVKYGMAENISYPDKKFDVITALDVIEHIKDDGRVLKNIMRNLKKGGTVIITTSAFPWMWSYWDEVAGHYRRYTALELRGIFEKAGLKIDFFRFYNNLMLLPAIIFRFIKGKMGGVTPEQFSSDFIKIPGPLNFLLTLFLELEILLSVKASIPFGLSFIVVAKKP